MSVGSRDLVLCAALLFAPLFPASMAAADSPKAGIEPRVETLMRDMSAYLEGAMEFTFRTEVNYDQVLKSGQKILYGRHGEISMRRPDRLHIIATGDLINERIWYDGKTFILMDLWNHEYVKVEVPPRIDEALDFMAREYGIASPVSDVLYSDVYAWIEDGVHPVPRKAVITYKNVTGSPQFIVWLSDWNFAPRLADSLFDFLPPEDARQVDIRPANQ